MNHLALLCLLAPLAAAAADSKLVAVLPVDARHAKTDAASRDTFEESLRTLAGRELTPHGYTVLTGATTLAVLADNAVDAEKVCEASCALSAARELKAALFVSSSLAKTEGAFVAHVRVFESAKGRQLSAVQLEGRSVRELRKELEERSDELFGHFAGEAPAVTTERREKPGTIRIEGAFADALAITLSIGPKRAACPSPVSENQPCVLRGIHGAGTLVATPLESPDPEYLPLIVPETGATVRVVDRFWMRVGLGAAGVAMFVAGPALMGEAGFLVVALPLLGVGVGLGALAMDPYALDIEPGPPLALR